MNISSLLQKVLFGAAALTLVAFGFFLGRQSARQTATTPSPTANTTFGSAFASTPLPAGETAEAAKSLSAAKKTWTSLQQQSPSPTTEESQCAQLKLMAAINPQQALELAASAATPRQRELFRNAALQGWATRDSHAAAVWTLANVRSEERRAAVEAIAAGAISQPDEAIRTFQHLVTADALLASDHGNALVYAFARAGNFDIASQFAATGPAEFRAAWLSTVYHQWAGYQPQVALAALDKISDPGARNEARSGLYAGWSGTDPASLVAHAQTLPLGEARLEALKMGLEQWVHLNPVAASAWMEKFDPAPDLDAGAAAIAVAPALVEKKPDIAVSWAESITDPELRANTLLDLIQLWAQHDPNAARRYASTSAAINAERRASILSSLEPPP
ncbi:MAG: hypothetical protein QM715_07160 [Nibricoccus sp.]